MPINDISIIRGFAVFDFFRVYNGKLFEFDGHLARFNASAKSIGLKVPFSKKEIDLAIQKLIEKNSTSKNKNFHVRMVLTGGEVKNGLEFTKPNMLILFETFKELVPKLFKMELKLLPLNMKDFCQRQKLLITFRRLCFKK